jgi:DNA-binding SARP family transcriptional activator
MATFKVLGALKITDGDRVCTPTQHRVRQVLALMALRPNRIVHPDLLSQELWDDNPPKTAHTTVQTYIYQLRKLLERAGTEEIILTRPPGYLLRTEPENIDAFAFQRLAWQGHQLFRKGEAERAAAVLRQALGLWTGSALADVSPGPVLQGHALALEEARLRALELRIQADLALGRHRDLIGELRLLVAASPYNEWFHEQLITALGRSDRRIEALQAYLDLRHTLHAELGLEPSSRIQQLQRQLLTTGV